MRSNQPAAARPGTPGAQAALPALRELVAPPAWRTLDFLSDLHLEAGAPATFEAWRRALEGTPADAVFLLGDLFEVWVGDDAAAPGSFEAQCLEVMRAAARRAPLFFLHGNRDFLVGREYLGRCGTTLLDDPTVLVFGGQRWLLSHGDALCLDDVDYLRFRAEVRSAAWQQAFLARPLAERQAIARGIRNQSEARKRTHGPEAYADVDAAEARRWLAAAQAETLIHGHTHRPAQHVLAPGLQRVVLTDWDLAAQPPRGELLRLQAAGAQGPVTVQRIPVL